MLMSSGRESDKLIGSSLVAAYSAKGPRDAYRGRLQCTPGGSLWYARYPFGRVRASFDFEQLTQPCVWDRYHGIALG
jgi:hypothetical protein